MKDNIYKEGEFSQGIMGQSNNAVMTTHDSQGEEKMTENHNPQRKKNFFERKRWLNYDVPKQPQSSAA